ncbi:unnamed protein product [Closterium sp. NIES-53]
MNRAMSNFQHFAIFNRLSPSQDLDLFEDRFKELFSVDPVSPLFCVTIDYFSNSPTLLSVDTAAIAIPQSLSEAISEWMAVIIAEWQMGLSCKAAAWELPVFKARYYAKGSTQREGIDYFATYSPIACLPTLRHLDQA